MFLTGIWTRGNDCRTRGLRPSCSLPVMTKDPVGSLVLTSIGVVGKG